MEGYEIMKLNGYQLVLKNKKRTVKVFPDANFMNTGKALVGILKIGQTLEQFFTYREVLRLAKEKEYKNLIEHIKNGFKRKD